MDLIELILVAYYTKMYMDLVSVFGFYPPLPDVRALLLLTPGCLSWVTRQTRRLFS